MNDEDNKLVLWNLSVDDSGELHTRLIKEIKHHLLELNVQ